MDAVELAKLIKVCYSLSTFAGYQALYIRRHSACVSTTKRCVYFNTMLTKRIKENVLKGVRRHATDTGSPEAQVALLSRQIEELSTHLRKHKKDFHSRRGLLQLVADRRKQLVYLESKDEKAYKALIKKLGIKR